MRAFLLKTTTVLLCAALAACGGGGSDSPAVTSNVSGASGTDGAASTGGTGGTTGASNAAGGTGGASGNTSSNGQTSTDTGSTASGSAAGTPGSTPGATPVGAFSATVTMAPADAEVLRGVVRLEVRGEGLGNVELLPAGETLPKLGVFTVSADRTTATLDFDTNTLPNGQLLARINAYDKPAGSADAREIAAMPVRRWDLRNDPEPTVAQVPPASWMPEVFISFTKLPYVDPAPLYELKQLDDASFENMLRNDWPTVEAIFRRYIPANVVLVPPTPLGFAGPWSSCMSTHGLLACKEVLVYLPGLMTSKAP